jgi:hypothetical protein
MESLKLKKCNTIYQPMKEKLNSKKSITYSKIKKYLNNPHISDTIIWLLSLPEGELSDSMLEAKQKMVKENQNEFWLAAYMDEKLKDELVELINWNNNII